jgi:hypothetical protein
VDSGKPIIGHVYWRMHDIQEQLQQVETSAAHRKDVTDIVAKRWEMLHSVMHAAGFVLEPTYQTYDQHANEEVMDGFWQVVGKLASPDDQTQIAPQLHKYRSKQGLFGREIAQNSIAYMPGYTWWENFGAGCPELQNVALKVLSQCSAASACERSWSHFDFIHNKRRNRLTPERANDLVFVFSNLRLLDKVEAVDYGEELF